MRHSASIAALATLASATLAPSSPAFANPLTPQKIGVCRSAQLPQTAGVTWSVSSPKELGTVTAGGLYTAPALVPAAPVTVTASNGTTASFAVAPAFPAAAAALVSPAPTSTDLPQFVHGAVARGKRVYALSRSGWTLSLSRSNDGGLTWGAPVRVGGGVTGQKGASIAIDAGDVETVYVVYQKVLLDGSGELRFQTSTDGGASFSVGTALVTRAGSGELANPDVVSPSAGVAVVAAPTTWHDDTTSPSTEGSYLLLWKLGPTGVIAHPDATWKNGYDAKATPSKPVKLQANHLLQSTNGEGGPTLATNGLGRVCVAYPDYAAPNEVDYVLCSTSSGDTFGNAVAVASTPQNKTIPRIAMAYQGPVEKGAAAPSNPPAPVVVVSWDKAADTGGAHAFKVSMDGGATFGSERKLADVPDASGKKPVAELQPFVDSHGDVWLARSVGLLSQQVFHTCGGPGGNLPLTSAVTSIPQQATGNLAVSFLFESSAGVFAGADHGTAPLAHVPVVARLLGP